MSHRVEGLTPVRGAKYAALGVALAVVRSLPAWGVPPVDPLPAPTFSFDLASPKVANGAVQGDMLLKPAPPVLTIEREGWTLGLGLLTDDVDGLSVAHAAQAADAPFVLLFSVDRATVGLAPPDPALVALARPYNVLDQASRGHAAGDEFMSTTPFTLDQSLGGTAAVVLWNDVLLRNNFDEGGTDFVAEPETSAETVVIEALQDNVDALTVVASATDVLYFSVTKDSPSLAGLHGRPVPSGADVFVFVPGNGQREAPGPGMRSDVAASSENGAPSCQADCCQQASALYSDCRAGGGTVEECAALAHDQLRSCLQDICGIPAPTPPGLYASSLDLGLRQGDDIDGLIVFDHDGDGLFSGADRVLFSLTPNSPSLSTLPGASSAGAGADVFLMTPGLAEPVLFAAAATLGLGHADDDIDALDFEPCTDPVTCAVAHGIQANASIPATSTWGLVLLALLMLVAGTLRTARRNHHAVA